MAGIQELWSDELELRLARFLRAVEEERLVDMVCALDFGSLDALNQAIDVALPALADAQSFGMAMGAAAQIGHLIQDVWGISLEVDADVQQEASLSHAFATKNASPRTLAALWAYTAQRAGMDAYWLEMSVFHPLNLSDDESSVLVDTTSGALVDKKGCLEIFDAITEGDEAFDAAMMERPSSREVAIAILELRLAAARHVDDDVAAWHAMRFHAELHRDKPAIMFASAVAALAMGDYGYAKKELLALREACAGTSLEAPIEKALEQVAQRQAYMH